MIELFGIPLRFHPLFIVLMAISAVTGYFVELLTLFGIVLIHELGHAIAARHFRWKVLEVQFLPFGGVAKVDDRGGVSAAEELIVAACGPLMNALMIAASVSLKAAGLWEGEWVDYFVAANAWIGLFNLLPALPLDGGKMLHALLSYRVPYYLTMAAGAWLGIAFAFALAAFACFYGRGGGLDLNVLAVALFILASNWIALRELHYRFMRFLIVRGPRAEELARKGGLIRPIVVDGRFSAAGVVRMFVREKYHLIYVLDENGAVAAVLPEHRLIRSVFEGRRPQGGTNELFM